jgi:SAM-dependent methyltransferase
MNHRETWKPSKFVYEKGKLIASRDPKEVSPTSRFGADIIAAYYDTYIPQHAKGRLLDLGCGQVPFYAAYKKFITDNICVDWANTSHKNEYLDMECDLNKPLPFQDNEFDTVLLSDVLEHIARPEELWNEMYRVLANHGKIMGNVPFYYWIHEQPYDYYRYTEFALRRYMDSLSLKIVRLESIGGVPEILVDILSKMSLRSSGAVRFAAGLAERTVKFILKTKYGKKYSFLTQKEFPLGYFFVAEKVG